MSDFTLTAGTLGHCTPSAKDAAGADTPFPAGAVFAWTSSDPSITFDDATLSSPAITGSVAVTGATITMSVSENGFTHTASHTVDVVAAAVDAIASVDFTIS